MTRRILHNKYDLDQYLNEDGKPWPAERDSYYILHDSDNDCYRVVYDVWCDGVRDNVYRETYEAVVCKTLEKAKRVCRRLIQRDNAAEAARQAKLDRVIQEGLAKLGPNDSIALEDVMPKLGAWVDHLRAYSEIRES